MPHPRHWTLTTTLTLALAIPALAGAPKSKAHKLVEKKYDVADLVSTLSQGPAGEGGADLLARALSHSVRTANRGHCLTHTEYRPDSRTVFVRGTADAQRQVASVLKALRTVCTARPPAPSCVMPAACDSSPEPAPLPRPAAGRSKQYTHFVLDNVKVNAMGVSCTIKRVRFMYKGDGIDADVAKCALTSGESEKKADVPKVLTDLLEKLDSGGASKTPKGETSFESIGIPASKPDEGKSDWAEVKKAGDPGAKVEKGKAKPE